MKLFRTIIALLLCMLLLEPYNTVATKEEGFQWEISNEALLASFWEADISSIREALSMDLITSTELTEYYLERIETYNETYNCFITLCDDALEQAAQRDAEIAAGEEGSLLGVPIVIKDNIDYAGYYTTNGYSKEESQIAHFSARIVEYLLQEGAVIIGKTNMSTGANDARVSTSIAAGETKNAYNFELASGGSSGGSAVATSLNFAVAGLGTDTNSSLRLPAVLNGCVSLRVTWDTLPMDGISRLNSTRDVPGVITRSVMDQAIMLDVLSGGETSYAENLNKDVLSGLRIGVLKELTYPTDNGRSDEVIDDEVAAAFEVAIDEMEACGAEVVEVSIPDIFSLSAATESTNNASYKERMYDVIQRSMEENDVSALIFPSYLHTPMRSGTDSNGEYWNVNNQNYINNTSLISSCASLPEIAITIGYHSLGAGIGMEIAALKNQEQLLLDIAYAYTTQYDHRQAPVNAEDLYSEDYTGSLADVIDSYYVALETYEKAEQPTKDSEAQTSEDAASDTAKSTAVSDKEQSQRKAEENHTDEQIVVFVLAVLIVALIICIVMLGIINRRSRRKVKIGH